MSTNETETHDLEQSGIGSVAIGAVVGYAITNALARRNGDSDDGSDGDTTNGDDTMNGDTGTSDELKELLAIQRRQKGTPQSIDSYAGQTLELDPGNVATVRVTPRDGFDLRVKRLYFDRRNDHNYSLTVDGTEISTNHQADFTAPRKITQGGEVVCEVENDSSESTEVDFEFEGWGTPSEHSS